MNSRSGGVISGGAFMEANGENNFSDTAPAAALPSKASIFAWVVCSLGALFYCYEYLLRIMPSVMSNDIMGAFHIDATAFGNLAAFYYYAYTPMQLPVGVLMDRYGPRRLLIFACLVCSVGSYLFASTHVLFIAQVGRFLVGFGSAFAFVGVLKLATVWLPPDRFALISGLTTTLGMLGAMAGDIVLTSVIKMQGWQSTIVASAVLGLVLALIIGLVMPDTQERSTKRILSRESPQTFGALFKGLFKLLRNPYIWAVGLVGCLMYLPLSAYAELWGIPYLQATHRFSDASPAHFNSMVFLGWAVCGPMVGWLSDKIRRRCLPMIIGSMGTALVFFTIFYVPDLSKTELTVLQFALGAFSSSQVLVFPIARELITSNLAATAIAVTNMLVMLGGVFFQPVIGYLLDMRWTGKIVNFVHVYGAAEYHFAMAALPISALIAAGIVMFLKETKAQISS